VPVVRGVVHVGERVGEHLAARHLYGEDRITLRWSKTRYRCREDYCRRGYFTESIEQVPARARSTRPAAFPDRRGIDETHRGKPRCEYRAETARWVRVDPWDTGFIDLAPVHDRSGPARLHDVVAGRSATALASWPSAQTADFAQTVQVIAMDGYAGYKTAAAQVMS
jgi:transposase